MKTILINLYWAEGFYLYSIFFMLIFYFICRKKLKSRKDIIFSLYAFVSMIFVLGLTIGNSDFAEITFKSILRNLKTVNFIPVVDLFFSFISAINGDPKEFINFFGNIALLIPVGFFYGAFLKNKKKNIIFVGIISSLSIEIVQIFCLRAFDVNDIILNTVGAYLGAYILNAMEVYDVKVVAGLNLHTRENKSIFFIMNLLIIISIASFFMI